LLIGVYASFSFSYSYVRQTIRWHAALVNFWAHSKIVID